MKLLHGTLRMRYLSESNAKKKSVRILFNESGKYLPEVLLEAREELLERWSGVLDLWVQNRGA